MPPRAANPGPILVKMPSEEVASQMRLLNTLFAPKSIGNMFQMVGRSIGDLGRNLMKTIIGQSQAIASVLEPVFTVLGIIGDFLVLTLLPQLRQFYAAMASAAKEFISGSKAAGAGTSNVDSGAMGGLFAAFIAQLVVALMPLVLAIVDLIVQILKTPGFVATLALILADLVLTVLDGITQLIDGVVMAMNGLLSDPFFGSVALFIGGKNAQALIDDVKAHATALKDDVGKLVNDTISTITKLVADLFNPSGVIWGTLTAILKGLVDWIMGGHTWGNFTKGAGFFGTGLQDEDFRSGNLFLQGMSNLTGERVSGFSWGF